MKLYKILKHFQDVLIDAVNGEYNFYFNERKMLETLKIELEKMRKKYPELEVYNEVCFVGDFYLTNDFLIEKKENVDLAKLSTQKDFKADKYMAQIIDTIKIKNDKKCIPLIKYEMRDYLKYKYKDWFLLKNKKGVINNALGFGNNGELEGVVIAECHADIQAVFKNLIK